MSDDQLEHVPTLPELAARGLAAVVSWTHHKEPRPSHYQATPAGQQLIYEAMERNALRGREQDQHEQQRAAEVRAAEGRDRRYLIT